MSSDITGGLNYALVKTHYDADDYIALPFTATQDYYLSGMMAYFSDPTVFNVLYGWTPHVHGQPARPAWLTTYILAGIIPDFEWPLAFPSFEAKDILFYSDQNCSVRFGGSLRVQHLIPANTYMRFHRRCFIFFVQSAGVDGTLYSWLEG